MTTADHAATTPWAGVQGKPQAFPPSAHTHRPSDIDRAGAVIGDVLTWDGHKFAPQAPNGRKLMAEANQAIARFEESLTLVADSSKALAQKTTVLEAKLGASEARFGEQVTALAKAGRASAERTSELVARLGEAEARIKRTDEVIVTRDTALARTTEEITARIGKNAASIVTIKSSYATRDFAEAKKSEALAAATEFTTASVTTEATARATADAAEATARLVIDAQVNDPTTGLAAAHAAVVTEATARVSADAAEATLRTAISAQVNDPTTGLPNAHSRITSEATARASGDSAIASTVTTLSATVGSVSAAVTTEASARASADGQIHARWGVALDVNGRVTGRIQLDGTNETSTLDFDAGTIRLWNGTADVAPFALSGGVVVIQNAQVGGLAINSDKLTSGEVIIGSTFANGVSAGDAGSNQYARMHRNPSSARPAFDLDDNGTIRGSFVLVDIGGGSIRSSLASNITSAGALTATNAGISGALSAASAAISGAVTCGSGSTGAPGLAFAAQSNTGWRWNSSGDMRAVTSGSDRLVVRDAAIVCVVPLKLDNAFTGGAPTATGYLTVQDSSGTTYKLLCGN